MRKEFLTPVQIQNKRKAFIAQLSKDLKAKLEAGQIFVSVDEYTGRCTLWTTGKGERK
jgi:hypothetical protein